MIPRIGEDVLPQELQSPRDRLRRLQSAKGRLEKETEGERKEQEEKIHAREAEEASRGKKGGRKPKATDESADHDWKADTVEPDSRIMETLCEFIQGYNGQAAVTQDQISIFAAATQDENDLHQLEPVIEEARRTVEEAQIQEPMGVSAVDTWYRRDDVDVQAIEKEGPELVLAANKDHKRRYHTDQLSIFACIMEDFSRNDVYYMKLGLIRHSHT